jgi:hypothetical protein
MNRLDKHQQTKQQTWDSKMEILKSEYEQVLNQRQIAMNEASLKDSKYSEIDQKVFCVIISRFKMLWNSIRMKLFLSITIMIILKLL